MLTHSLRMTSSCNEHKTRRPHHPLVPIYKCHRHLMKGLKRLMKKKFSEKRFANYQKKKGGLHCDASIIEYISLAANAIRIENVFGSQNKRCRKSFNEHPSQNIPHRHIKNTLLNKLHNLNAIPQQQQPTHSLRFLFFGAVFFFTFS